MNESVGCKNKTTIKSRELKTKDQMKAKQFKTV